MNYILQILGIRKTERQRGEPISLAAFRLHHTLLAISNSRGWPNPVFISSAEIFAESRLAENTVARARRELEAAGLIQYTTSKGRGHAAAYYIKPFTKEDFNTEKPAAFEDFNGGKSLEKPAAFEDQYTHINRSSVDKSGRQAENPNNLGILDGAQAERENPAKETETAQGAAAPGNAGNRAILDDNARGGGIPQPDHERPLSANSGKNNSPGGTGPTLAQVEAEQRAKGYKLEAARFYSHFAPDWKTANGEPVRSWRKLYAWCETNGLFDTAPQKTQEPQLPPRGSTEYEDMLPPECYETQPETDAAGDGERLDLVALERELIGGGGQQPRNSRYL